MSSVALLVDTTVRAVARRRLTVAILVIMPVALYLASSDAPGRAVRALVFGLSWSVSTVAFFATLSAREIEPRLELAGWPPARLLAGRLLGLTAMGAGLTTVFAVLVAVDQDVRSLGGVVLDFSVTVLVAIGIGTALGTYVRAEMEGTLILFFLSGLQAVVNPFDGYSRLLPFWSSRELGTYAIDGPEAGSLANGLIHATAVLLICGAALAVDALSGPRLRTDVNNVQADEGADR